MKPGAAYYANGARVLVDGVPIKLARKPSATNLARLREHERHRVKRDIDYYGRDKHGREARAKVIAKQANDAIALYAEILELSETRAKALIAQHRRHLLAHPVADISLEFDL